MNGRLVIAARAYLGTRWRHRGRSVHGLDCAGLGLLAYRDCGVVLPDYLHYGREPHKDGLIKYLTAALGEPLAMSMPLADGDVIVLRFDREPHHVTIVAAANYAGINTFNIIHADGHVGRVLEQRLTADMLARVTHHYRKEP